MKLLEHKYGEHIHILDDLYLNTILARLCRPDIYQPVINDYVERLYLGLLYYCINQFFSKADVVWDTRMTEVYSDCKLKAEVINPNLKVVSVNLARAGTWPSHICYHHLNHILDPKNVRQDHIFAARKTNADSKVEGTDLGSSKIGGDIENSIVLIPDPMGATGGTILETVKYYDSHLNSNGARYYALHLIVTPEYLKRVTHNLGDKVSIVALRVDRGFSDKEILNSIPGEHWDKEKGLDQNQYIVPGAGGLGEILNNSFV